MLTSELVADRWQRPLRVLRLSLTARCNLACSYCQPDHREVSGLLNQSQRLALIAAPAVLASAWYLAILGELHGHAHHAEQGDLGVLRPNLALQQDLTPVLAVALNVGEFARARACLREDNCGALLDHVLPRRVVVKLIQSRQGCS